MEEGRTERMEGVWVCVGVGVQVVGGFVCVWVVCVWVCGWEVCKGCDMQMEHEAMSLLLADV